MALSQRLVDLIFTRMLVRYGTAWASKWRGVEEAAVHADWAHELDGASEAAIRYALDYLPPEFPPTVVQFKALCINRPVPMPPRLPAPKADPARVAAMLQKAAAALKHPKPLDWAYRLQEREKAGEALTCDQRKAWREALTEVSLESLSGWFSPIDPNCLPPAMRDHA